MCRLLGCTSLYAESPGFPRCGDCLREPCDLRGCQNRSKSGRGRAARQPSDTRFEVGSTPAGPTVGSVEQPGVLAAPTSRRSLVQIQPGLLASGTHKARLAPGLVDSSLDVTLHGVREFGARVPPVFNPFV